jgi:hypothetical protein
MLIPSSVISLQVLMEILFIIACIIVIIVASIGLVVSLIELDVPLEWFGVLVFPFIALNVFAKTAGSSSATA